MLQELTVLCRLAWGSEFPKPVSMELDQWRVGNPIPKPPAATGRHRRSLEVISPLCCSVGAMLLPGNFDLPGNLTAQDLGDLSGSPVCFDPASDQRQRRPWQTKFGTDTTAEAEAPPGYTLYAGL